MGLKRSGGVRQLSQSLAAGGGKDEVVSWESRATLSAPKAVWLALRSIVGMRDMCGQRDGGSHGNSEIILY